MAHQVSNMFTRRRRRPLKPFVYQTFQLTRAVEYDCLKIIGIIIMTVVWVVTPDIDYVVNFDVFGYQFFVSLESEL